MRHGTGDGVRISGCGGDARRPTADYIFLLPRGFRWYDSIWYMLKGIEHGSG